MEIGIGYKIGGRGGFETSCNGNECLKNSETNIGNILRKNKKVDKCKICLKRCCIFYIYVFVRQRCCPYVIVQICHKELNLLFDVMCNTCDCR